MVRSASPKQPSAGYPSLEARVRHVSEATIRKKWKKLPSSNHTAAREAILAAKDQSRSRRGRNTVDTATEDCVQDVANKLTDRLPRIPFPPSTDEDHFDHEANINRIAKIEGQLTAHIHSINLLRAQIAKEEELLQQDQAEVDHLEHSLKSNEILRREQSRTLHPIARRLGQGRCVDLLALAQQDKKPLDPSFKELYKDDEIRPILLQLQNHLDSMENNIADLVDVQSIVKKAASDVEAYTFSTLDESTYRPAAGLGEENQT